MTLDEWDALSPDEKHEFAIRDWLMRTLMQIPRELLLKKFT